MNNEIYSKLVELVEAMKESEATEDSRGKDCPILWAKQHTTHMIGKCLHCDREHHGLFGISVYNELQRGPIIELGVRTNDSFHPIEIVTLVDLLQCLTEE